MREVHHALPHTISADWGLSVLYSGLNSQRMLLYESGSS
ncbi:Uncharacterised protein [Vibrio cholerae]|nr:Uncharacterised protein [Vibrio cholerae]CSI38127.1 Uncharacterised protein [Vibrio cholerae]